MTEINLKLGEKDQVVCMMTDSIVCIFFFFFFFFNNETPKTTDHLFHTPLLRSRHFGFETKLDGPKRAPVAQLLSIGL